MILKLHMNINHQINTSVSESPPSKKRKNKGSSKAIKAKQVESN